MKPSSTLLFSPQIEPVLAPPGAGLPFVELRIARLLFTLRRWATSHAQSTAEFVRERDEILRLVRSCPPEDGATRVLVDRIAGMEDSSRYWSAWMTLEHLRLVNTGIAQTIQGLCLGRAPMHQASTADVKPSPNADSGAIDGFVQSCDLVIKAGADASKLKTKVLHAHPWFGPLDGRAWYDMAAFHQRLHRHQLEKVLAGLRQSSQ